jgi:hypothetical protein
MPNTSRQDEQALDSVKERAKLKIERDLGSGLFDPHRQKRTAQEARDCLKLASYSIGLLKPLAECNLTGL